MIKKSGINAVNNLLIAVFIAFIALNALNAPVTAFTFSSAHAFTGGGCSETGGKVITGNEINESKTIGSGAYSDFFKAAPQKPPAYIIELLGRYQNITNAKDNFLILEDNKMLKMHDGRGFFPVLQKTGLKYICIKDAYTNNNALEFIKLPDTSSAASGANKIYCTFRGRLYHKINYGAEDGGVYKIKPLKPAGELRKAALSAVPPRETDINMRSDLVDLRNIGGSFIFDIRYAGVNNFMGERFYDSACAFLQKPAAHSLLYADRMLSRHGFGVIVYDAYRPWHVTKMFYEATPDAQKNFVADPAKGSRHNRGTAVDIGLYDLKTGELIDMGSGYDEFSERASPSYAGGTSYGRWHRKLLEYYMNKAGFTVYEDEWWHFDYKLGILKYPILNLTFDKLR
jgi:D-alanyl-D-alanine dipeptidase